MAVSIKRTLLENMSIKAKYVKDLNGKETQILMAWADWNSPCLPPLEEITLQQVLDMYRISSRYNGLRAFAEKDPPSYKEARARILGRM